MTTLEMLNLAVGLGFVSVWALVGSVLVRQH
jgi:hypothetical protein